jgi:hypothetical protein
MLTSKSLKMLAALFLVWATNGSAQNCENCEGSAFGFGYPGAHSSSFGSRHQLHKEKWHAWKAEADKSYARNDAWPKPFNCQDRMAYYSVWDTMITQGYANHCVLGADHFDAEKNELNAAGRMKVAGIMQNIPADRRRILISRDHIEQVSQARVASVNAVVQTYYSQSAGNMMVALTDLQPTMFSGNEADTIVKRRLEGLPPAVIPLVSSGTSISGSADQ